MAKLEFESKWYNLKKEINGGAKWTAYTDSLSVDDMNKIVSCLIYISENIQGVTIDYELDETSNNAIANSAVATAIKNLSGGGNIVKDVKVNGESVVDNETKIANITLKDVGIDVNVDNLVNYYLKSETYSKDEINSIINNISSFGVEIVTALPTSNISTTTFYLIAKTDSDNNDYYDEYLYIGNRFELVGNTKINLSDYYKKTESDNLFVKQDNFKTSVINNDAGFIKNEQDAFDFNNLANKPVIPEGSVLYSTTGQNTDGAMTQKAATESFLSKDDGVAKQDIGAFRYFGKLNSTTTIANNSDAMVGKATTVGQIITHFYFKKFNASADGSSYSRTDLCQQKVRVDAIDEEKGTITVTPLYTAGDTVDESGIVMVYSTVNDTTKNSQNACVSPYLLTKTLEKYATLDDLGNAGSSVTIRRWS